MKLDQTLERRYEEYLQDYRRYLRRRGYGNHLNDWPFARRAFLICWAQPGFHRFWRIYNPGIAYFCFRLYRRVGGNKRKVTATFGSFMTCGLAHNLIVLPFLGWSFTLPAAFAFYASASLLSLRFDSLLQFRRWPIVIHMGLNLTLALAGMAVGFRTDRLLQSCW